MTDLENALVDRDRLVSQLATERARLGQILNQMPVGVTIAEGPEGEIVFENRRSQEILGPARCRNAFSASQPGNPLHPDGTPYAQGETPSERALRGEQGVDEFNVRRPDGRIVMIRASGAPVGPKRDGFRARSSPFEDVSEQKRREESVRFLSEASRQLSDTIDYEKTLARIAELAVPAMADWISIELLEHGAIQSLVVSHTNPVKVQRAEELRRRYPVELDTPHGIANVLRTGQAELYADVNDELLAKVR